MELNFQVVTLRVSYHAYVEDKYLVIETDYGNEKSTQLHLDFGELLQELKDYYSLVDGTYDEEWVTFLQELKRAVDELLEEVFPK